MITVDIKSCARCGDNHDQLAFKELKDPMEVILEVDGQKYKETYTYWAMCPNLSEPIMLQVLPTI